MERNAIIKSWGDRFIRRVNEARRALGIKHNRHQEAKNNRIRYKTLQGDIDQISVVMTKGDIMTHKGKGRSEENRKEKPFYNPVAEEMIPELADTMAENWGDHIAKGLIK